MTKIKDQELDLHDAYMIGANLSSADLRGANLRRANLRRADLSDADLTDADLTGANLYGANLTGADLNGADLTGANLDAAHLQGAKLGWVDFKSGPDNWGAYDPDRDKMLDYINRATTQKQLDDVAIRLDDDIREQVNAELAPCTTLDFIRRYYDLDPDGWISAVADIR